MPLSQLAETKAWLSINNISLHLVHMFDAQVEIRVDDGLDGGRTDDDGTDTIVVEAGTLGAVTPMAVLYDPRLGNANGCDPAGCTAALTRVRRRSIRCTPCRFFHFLTLYMQKKKASRSSPVHDHFLALSSFC